MPARTIVCLSVGKSIKVVQYYHQFGVKSHSYGIWLWVIQKILSSLILSYSKDYEA